MRLPDGGLRQGRDQARHGQQGATARSVASLPAQRAGQEEVCRRHRRVGGPAGVTPGDTQLELIPHRRWSSKHGEYPAGDPELHHVIGALYADEGEVYDAERHLTLGTSDSAQKFADLEYEWYASDEPSTAAAYAARAVIPYLLVGNTRAANKALLLFTSKLSATHPGLGVQSISSAASDIRVYPSLPLLNFLGLLLLAVQRGGSDLFKQLKQHYAPHLKETGWDEALAQIGEMYFGIKIPSQSNPMFDMMSSMLMGGNNPFAPKKKEPRSVGPSGAASPAPPAPGLD